MSSALIDNGSSCNSKVREKLSFFYCLDCLCWIRARGISVIFLTHTFVIPEAVESRTHGVCDFIRGVRGITKGVTIHAGRIYSHRRGPVLR